MDLTSDISDPGSHGHLNRIGGQRRGRPPHPSGVHGNDEPSKCAALPEGFGCDGQRFS